MIGAGLTNFSASNNTLVQLFVTDDLRGRVMSTYQLAAVGMTPLGALKSASWDRTWGRCRRW